MVYRFLIEYPAPKGVATSNPGISTHSEIPSLPNNYGIDTLSNIYFCLLVGTVCTIFLLLLCTRTSSTAVPPPPPPPTTNNGPSSVSSSRPTLSTTGPVNTAITTEINNNHTYEEEEEDPSSTTVDDDDDEKPQSVIISTTPSITSTTTTIPPVSLDPVPARINYYPLPTPTTVPILRIPTEEVQRNPSVVIDIPSLSSCTPIVSIQRAPIDHDDDDNHSSIHPSSHDEVEEDPNIITVKYPPTASTIIPSSSTSIPISDRTFVPVPTPNGNDTLLSTITVPPSEEDTILPINYTPTGAEHEFEHAEFLWPENCQGCYFPLRYSYRFVMCEAGHVLCFPCAILSVRRLAKASTGRNRNSNVYSSVTADNKCGVGDPSCPFVILSRTVGAVYRNCRILDDILTNIASNPVPQNSLIMEGYEMLNGVTPLTPQEVPTSLRGIAPPPLPSSLSIDRSLGSSGTTTYSSLILSHDGTTTTSVSSRRLQLLQNKLSLSQKAVITGSTVPPDFSLDIAYPIDSTTTSFLRHSTPTGTTTASAPVLSDEEIQATLPVPAEASTIPFILRLSTEFDIFIDDNGKRCPNCQSKVPVQFLFHRKHHRNICPNCKTKFCYVCLVPIPILNPEDDDDDDDNINDDQHQQLCGKEILPFKVSCPNDCPYACTSVKKTVITENDKNNQSLSIHSFDIVCDCQDCPYCKPGLPCSQCPFPLGCFRCMLPGETDDECTKRHLDQRRIQRQYITQSNWIGPQNNQTTNNNDNTTTDNNDGTQEEIPVNNNDNTTVSVHNSFTLPDTDDENNDDDNNKDSLIDTMKPLNLSDNVHNNVVPEVDHRSSITSTDTDLSGTYIPFLSVSNNMGDNTLPESVLSSNGTSVTTGTRSENWSNVLLNPEDDD